MGLAPEFEGIPSVPVLVAGLLSDTTLRISHIPILTASNDRRSRDRVIGVTKVQSLVTAPKSDISVCASNRDGYSQSRLGILSRVVVEADQSIPPWSVLKHVTD